MNLNQKRFITVEGIDGAGKTSNLSVIEAWVKQQGFDYVITREPGGTPLGEKLREILLHETIHNPMTELLLMYASRAEHLKTVIEPALQRGAFVICDRFNDSTMAYQGGGRAMNVDFLHQLSTMLDINTRFNPDLTLVFDVDLNIAQHRKSLRLHNNNNPLYAPDKFETAPSAFIQAVQAMYHQLIKDNPERCVLINTDKPMECVQSQVITVLNQRFL